MAIKPYTFQVDEQLMLQFAQLARARGSSPDELLPHAIRDFILAESDSGYNQWFQEQVQTGIDQINAGECVSGDEVEAEFAALRANSTKRHG